MGRAGGKENTAGNGDRDVGVSPSSRAKKQHEGNAEQRRVYTYEYIAHSNQILFLNVTKGYLPQRIASQGTPISPAMGPDNRMMKVVYVDVVDMGGV